VPPFSLSFFFFFIHTFFSVWYCVGQAKAEYINIYLNNTYGAKRAADEEVSVCSVIVVQAVKRSAETLLTVMLMSLSHTYLLIYIRSDTSDAACASPFPFPSPSSSLQIPQATAIGPAPYVALTHTHSCETCSNLMHNQARHARWGSASSFGAFTSPPTKGIHTQTCFIP
jgi:hypothetical protein